MVHSNILKTCNSDLDLGSGYDSGLPIPTGQWYKGVYKGVQECKGVYRVVKVCT